MILLLYVSLDYFIGNIAAAATKISSCPNVAPPIRLTQMGKPVKEFVRGFFFYSLYQAAYRNSRWNRDKQVYMICRHVTFQNFHIFRAAYLTDHIANSARYISDQDALTVLGDPHHMQMNLKNRVCSMPIFSHGRTVANNYLLKLSPKGEGFNPPKETIKSQAVS